MENIKDTWIVKRAYELWENDYVKKDGFYYWSLAEREFNINSDFIIRNLFWKNIKINSYTVEE